MSEDDRGIEVNATGLPEAIGFETRGHGRSGYAAGMDRAAEAGARMKIENSSRCDEMRILA